MQGEINMIVHHRILTRLLFVLVFLATANLNFADARAQNAAQPAAYVGEKTDSSTRNFPNAPQVFVVCTGWHALCSASPDCKMKGDKASCDCLRVNETHIVETFAIRDPVAKRLTQARCTSGHPCEV